MAKKFAIEGSVHELMKAFDVENSFDASMYTEQLMKHISPFVSNQTTVHHAKLKIASYSPNSNEFLIRYDQLKSKAVKNLDAYVHFLSLTISKEDIIPMLASQKLLADVNSGASRLGLDLKMKDNLPLESIRKNLRNIIAKRNPNSEIANLPNWLFDRPNLRLDYPTVPITDFQNQSISQLPMAVQDQALVEDLLFVMSGVGGKYIKYGDLSSWNNRRSFSLDPSFDPSLKELVERILPLCSDFSIVSRFVDEKCAYEYGEVSHALAAAMQDLLKEYFILIAQLESQFRRGNLSLQKLFFYIQPTASTLNALASAAYNSDVLTSGAILTMLHYRAQGTNNSSLWLHLAQCASKPFFDILQSWIYTGQIDDPYCEFFVYQSPGVVSDDLYWEKKYVLVPQNIPSFMEPLANMILCTGKYLNVIRRNEDPDKMPDIVDLTYSLEERKMFDIIKSAHQEASRKLLDLLLRDNKLMSRLRSMKQYFLMGQGDLFLQFMDTAEEELKKKAIDCDVTKLESLLELASNTCSSSADPFKDDLRIVLLPEDLLQQMQKISTVVNREKSRSLEVLQQSEITCLESLAMDCVIKWPMNLVLSRGIITRYQMLFRHVFYIKHVERQLCDVWINLKDYKRYQHASLQWYSKVFALREKMMVFIQNLELYFMFEVIESHWHVLEEQLSHVDDVEVLLQAHADFLDRCLKECMLTTPKLLTLVFKICATCVLFSNKVQRLTRSARLQINPEFADPKVAVGVASSHAEEMARMSSFEKSVATFDNNFTKLLVELLERLVYYTSMETEFSMANIIFRLDYNGFYTPLLEKLQQEVALKSSGDAIITKKKTKSSSKQDKKH